MTESDLKDAGHASWRARLIDSTGESPPPLGNGACCHGAAFLVAGASWGYDPLLPRVSLSHRLPSSRRNNPTRCSPLASQGPSLTISVANSDTAHSERAGRSLYWPCVDKQPHLFRLATGLVQATQVRPAAKCAWHRRAAHRRPHRVARTLAELHHLRCWAPLPALYRLPPPTHPPGQAPSAF